MNLSFDAVGSYKTGCFYSEAAFGIPYETDFFLGIGRRGEFASPFGTIEGGPDGTLRAVTLLHETAHFVQDLTLGCAIECDYLLDEGLGVLLGALRSRGGKTVRLPLAQNKGQLDEEHLNYVSSSFSFANALFERATDIDLGRERHSVSGRVLMESLAAAQAARSLRDRCHSDDDRAHLEQAGSVHQLTPEQLGSPYGTVERIFCLSLGRLTDTRDDTNWPWNTSPDSSSGLADVASALIADIACQIPPSEIILERIKSGANKAEDFWPGSRFAHAIAAVGAAGGFPDLADFDEVYRATFNLVARRWGWPEWDETINSWLAKVQAFKDRRKSAGDAYRFRLLVEKYNRPGMFALGDPVLECFRQGLPLIYLTPNGLKVLTMTVAGDTTSIVPMEIESGLSAWDWLNASTRPWEDTIGPIHHVEAHRRLSVDQVPMLLQEVTSRIFSRGIHRAILEGESFRCPFASAGCDAAMPQCANLRITSDAPIERCALRAWLSKQGIDEKSLLWNEGR